MCASEGCLTTTPRPEGAAGHDVSSECCVSQSRLRARELVTAAARGAHRAPNDHRRCDGTDTVQREQALESMFAARSFKTPTRVYARSEKGGSSMS